MVKIIEKTNFDSRNTNQIIWIYINLLIENEKNAEVLSITLPLLNKSFDIIKNSENLKEDLIVNCLYLLNIYIEADRNTYQDRFANILPELKKLLDKYYNNYNSYNTNKDLIHLCFEILQKYSFKDEYIAYIIPNFLKYIYSFLVKLEEEINSLIKKNSASISINNNSNGSNNEKLNFKLNFNRNDELDDEINENLYGKLNLNFKITDSIDGQGNKQTNKTYINSTIDTNNTNKLNELKVLKIALIRILGNLTSIQDDKLTEVT